MTKEYDINGKGIPTLENKELLLNEFKKLANEEYYNTLDLSHRDYDINPHSAHGDKVNMRPIDTGDRRSVIKLLKKCFPSITFRLTGFFLYGPGDYMSEHTNADDPGNTMYITYATGESSFSYRFSTDDDFTVTPDEKDDITIRTFSVTSEGPFTHHKVDCESGYRLSIGMRYVQIK